MINVLELQPGTRVELTDGSRVTVIENMGDGQWIEASPDGATGGELIHCQDVARIVVE